ncbi:MAG: pyruvate, phosphate dikinase, partial [Candidatus Ranarchaeia archaeon]
MPDTTSKRVFLFGEIEPDKNFLGGKGAGLARMTQLGLPVPPGFTIPTPVCVEYLKENKFPEGLMDEVRQAMAELENKTGKKFGRPDPEVLPLLVSVRSGARISMPGMMDTILNLGLNDEIAEAFIQKIGNERFVYDSYRRFIEMFGNVAMGIERKKFEEKMDEEKAKVNPDVKQVKDTDLAAAAMKRLVEDYKEVYRRELGSPFPQEPYEQLRSAIESVFKSWNNTRAIKYRRINRIPDDYGTAVNVQVMAFGNVDNRSGSGVGFTRNPSNGEAKFYAEYLTQAQGEDVVAGIRTPEDIATVDKKNYDELLRISKILEREYRDMMDIEFTIEQGKLYMLQCRVGKRTASAAIKIAVDMVREGLISEQEAVLRVKPEQIDQLLHPQIDPKIKPSLSPIGTGLNASPGSVTGHVVLSSSKAEELHLKDPKYPMILVAEETLAEDVGGMAASRGILTATGGKTSHAAVVARGMGKPCVVGVRELVIKEDRILLRGQEFREGDVITIDGAEGKVYAGEVPLVPPKITGDAQQLLDWADNFARLKVRAN